MDAPNATEIGILGHQPAGPVKRRWVFTFLGFRVAALVLQNIHMGVLGCSCPTPPKCFWRFKTRGLGTRAGLSKWDFGGRKSCVRERGRAWVQYWGRYVVQLKAPLLKPRMVRAQNAEVQLGIHKEGTQHRGGKWFLCYYRCPFQLRISAPFLHL